MHEKVKEFLETKKAEERKKFEEEKQKTLFELGLFEKEYAPEGNYNRIEYNEWDATVYKWYKKIADIEVSDEEYAEILKYTTQNENIKTKNPISTILKVFAWIVFICGFIVGIILERITYNPVILFTVWCVAFVEGVFFLTFAEIIKLLNEIKNK